MVEKRLRVPGYTLSLELLQTIYFYILTYPKGINFYSGNTEKKVYTKMTKVIT